MSKMTNTNNNTDTSSIPAPAQVVAGRRTRYKRARSAYAFYASDKSVREAIQKAHPDWKFGEVSKALGAKWATMDEAARQPYVEQSQAERASISSNQGPVQKRGRSAYAFYMKDATVREAIQKAHPDWDFGQVSKAIGEQWKALSAEAKAPYEKVSSEERAHVEATSVASKPKRGRSAYAFYMKDSSVREAIQKAHPDWEFGQVSKALGEQWKAMDTTQRQPYVDQSDAEKAEVQAAQPDVTEEATPGVVVKPKRARSAYAYYMKDTSVREAIQKAHPDWDFGEVSKAIGEQWKAMDTTQRQPYVDQSEAEKAEIGSATVTVTTGRKPRARSAYNFYMKDASVREAIQTAHPDWKFAEVSKALGEQWKALDETARQPYLEQAEADRAKVEAATPVVKSASPNGKKRARSAYAFYASDKSVREAIQKAHPDWKFGEVSKALGEQWKAMDATQRQSYVDQSEAEKAEFASVQSVVVGTEASAPAPKAVKTKRGRSAYAFYAGDKKVREALQKAHPDWKFGEVSKAIGQQWKAMDEAARQPYVDQSVAEKASLAAAPVAAPAVTTSVTKTAPPKVAKAKTPAKSVATKPVPAAKPASKRGRTAYNYYLMDKSVREAVQKAHPDWKFGEIVKELSANWKTMDEAAKAPYVQQATSQ